MRLATWNVNSLKARLERVLDWLGRIDPRPDVFCMQETKVTDADLPAEPLRALGYELAHHGLGRWNGVAIASRVGIEDVTAGLAPTADGWADEGGRFLAATCGGMRVASVYVPNGRVVGSEFYAAKLTWLDRLGDWVEGARGPAVELAVCGDFNVAPDDTDVWDPAAVHGATHVSPEERARVARLRDLGLVDVVRRFHPEAGYFTWWDYRAGAFHKNLGMRIDHVYASEPLAARAVAAARDRDARKPKSFAGIPSDHAPVVVDFS
ncbi:MAG TPA: exodeoxyribonuclease III [Kofleriaceae bacterium]|nr:exodeoxyribonuclease III [Kofleriaceae bacterium]